MRVELFGGFCGGGVIWGVLWGWSYLGGFVVVELFGGFCGGGVIWGVLWWWNYLGGFVVVVLFGGFCGGGVFFFWEGEGVLFREVQKHMWYWDVCVCVFVL